MLYRFYSRRNGWPEGVIVHYYYTHQITDIDNRTSSFVDKSGEEIYKLIESNQCWIKDPLMKEISEYAKKWNNWYYYQKDTIITDMTVY